MVLDAPTDGLHHGGANQPMETMIKTLAALTGGAFCGAVAAWLLTDADATAITLFMLLGAGLVIYSTIRDAMQALREVRP